MYLQEIKTRVFILQPDWSQAQICPLSTVEKSLIQFSLWGSFLLPRFLLPFCKHYLQLWKIHDKKWFHKLYDYNIYIQEVSFYVTSLKDPLRKISLFFFLF